MLYNRCTGIYKFGNNTYPRRIRRGSNLGHIFRGKKCVLCAGKYGNVIETGFRNVGFKKNISSATNVDLLWKLNVKYRRYLELRKFGTVSSRTGSSTRGSHIRYSWTRIDDIGNIWLCRIPLHYQSFGHYIDVNGKSAFRRLFLSLRLLMSYIYGAPSKARNANVVYIWIYVWQR